MMIIPIVLLLHLTMIVPLIVIYRERERKLCDRHSEER